MCARKNCQKQKKRLFVLSVALLCVGCLLFVGCSSNNQTNGGSGQTGSNQTQNGQTGSNSGNAPDGSDQNSATGNVAGSGDGETADNSDLHQRAEKIASAITEKIDQVKDARAVISERMAYVSVSIDAEAGAAESSALKDAVSEVVKETDTEIETVYVMEDADTFTRMKEIGDDIAAGKPVAGFAEELKTMFARVIPTKE